MGIKSYIVMSMTLAMLMLSGCESTSTLQKRSVFMDTWLGKHIDRLTYIEGAPSTKIERSDGGYVYTWIWSGQVQCRENYVTDSDGIIINWSYAGCTEHVRVKK